MTAIRLPLVLLLTMAALSATPAALADPTHATSYSVSLGDSLSQGFQPTFDLDHGYADQLYALLRARSPKLEHVKLAWFILAELRAAGDPVAYVEGAFATTDLSLVSGTPRNVVNVCAWTRMCAPPPLGPDIHPNTAGYGVIAQAFADVVGGVAP
jgi:hypothetical protein